MLLTDVSKLTTWPRGRTFITVANELWLRSFDGGKDSPMAWGAAVHAHLIKLTRTSQHFRVPQYGSHRCDRLDRIWNMELKRALVLIAYCIDRAVAGYTAVPNWD